MLFQKMKIDERTRSNSQYAATIWLGVTQILLASVVFYRLYVVGQADAEIRDFQAVLAISIFGGLALQLFLGGALPMPTWRGALLSWLILASAVAGDCLLIYGWPKTEDWASTWLPSLLGPAIILAAYALVARLGQWRIERQLQGPKN